MRSAVARNRAAKQQRADPDGELRVDGAALQEALPELNDVDFDPLQRQAPAWPWAVVEGGRSWAGYQMSGGGLDLLGGGRTSQPHPPRKLLVDPCPVNCFGGKLSPTDLGLNEGLITLDETRETTLEPKKKRSGHHPPKGYKVRGRMGGEDGPRSTSPLGRGGCPLEGRNPS